MRAGINRVTKKMIFIMPDYIHEFGDRFHHMSMIRTGDFDEEGSPIEWTGFSNRRYIIHDLLDGIVFYPISDWLSKWVGDNDLYDFLRIIVGFFWGLNCGFPLKDVASYFVWNLRGNKPVAVFKMIKGKWLRTY